MRGLQVALVLIFVVVASTTYAADTPLEDPVQEAAARVLMKEIRCLVCQNQSIEDSNADLAKDLRDVVRERVALGASPEEVRAYLVERYGDWVLLKPPVNRLTFLLWGSPFFVLAGVFVALITFRKKRQDAAPLSADEKALLKKLMLQSGQEKEGIQ